MRWVSFGELNARNAQRPDVGLVVVAELLVGLARDYLGRHPVRRAYERIYPMLVGRILRRHREVSYLDLVRVGQQNVARFHVSMYHILSLVQVVKRLESSFHYILNLRLVERETRVFVQNFVYGSTRAIFYKDLENNNNNNLLD